MIVIVALRKAGMLLRTKIPLVLLEKDVAIYANVCKQIAVATTNIERLSLYSPGTFRARNA